MVWIYGLSKNIRDHENMIFNFHLIWKDHPPACHRRKLPRLLPRWKWGSQSHRRSKPSWFSPLWFLGKMKMLWNWSEWKYKMCFKWVLWNWKLKFVKVKVAYRTMGRWWWHQLCRRCSWKSQTFPSLTLEPTCKGFFHAYFQTAALSFETWFEVCLPHLLVSGLREGKHGDWRRPCTSLNIFARLKQEDFKSCITLGHTWEENWLRVQVLCLSRGSRLPEIRKRTLRLHADWTWSHMLMPKTLLVPNISASRPPGT